MKGLNDIVNLADTEIPSHLLGLFWLSGPANFLVSGDLLRVPTV